MYSNVRFPYSDFFILARHLAFLFIVLVWVAFLTTPGFVCPDLKIWSEEDLTLADQADFEEQAALQ